MNPAIPMPTAVAAIRRQICGRCDAPCAAHLAGQIDHAEPATECPREWSGRWGRHGRAGGPAITRAQEPPAAQLTTHAPREAIPAVPLLTKARRLALALVKWAQSGFRLVDHARRLQRRRICRACPSYKPTGNLWMGECLDPRCGCTRLKQWLATERCPQGKWPGSAPARPLQRRKSRPATPLPAIVKPA